MGLFYFSDLQEIAGVSADTAVMEKEKEKTQLMLIALTSKYRLKDIILGTATAILVLIWLACSLGLFAADILGMMVGYLLKSKTPEGLLNMLAFVIFSIFGVYTLYQGLNLISESVCSIPVLPVLIAVAIVFAVLCVCLFIKREKLKIK